MLSSVSPRADPSQPQFFPEHFIVSNIFFPVSNFFSYPDELFQVMVFGLKRKDMICYSFCSHSSEVSIESVFYSQCRDGLTLFVYF